MTTFSVDLHIHTCLSPCSERLMRPSMIAYEAKRKHLSILAITDHNSSENVDAVTAVCAQLGVTVIGGMEVTSREEVHVVVVFPGSDSLSAMQELVYAHLPGKNAVDIFGEQLIVNDRDRIVAENPRMLIGATELSLEQIVERAHELQGLAIAAHVDREAFSVIGQLGLIPDGIAFDALELSRRAVAGGPESVAQFSGLGFPLIASSDAHMPDQMGRPRTEFRMAEPSFGELRRALRAEAGRWVRIADD